MAALQELIPDVQTLLGFSPEELAPYLLQIAKSQLQHGMFHIQSINSPPIPGVQNAGYAGRAKEVQLATSEAMNWLQVQGLLVPAAGSNGTNGWVVISRRGQKIANADDFRRFQDTMSFPKDLLHPSIAEKVWLDLARGDLADAVFVAFRAVEEAVRIAGGYAAADIGVPLMRKAFDPGVGPLADKMQERGEQEALAHMFAGAIGSYKNPHSHRTVSITDPREAQEMVMHASHLLRIVETRAALRKATSAP
jgi:uncharacterized protein (TIGR02391 family)